MINYTIGIWLYYEEANVQDELMHIYILYIHVTYNILYIPISYVNI